MGAAARLEAIIAAGRPNACREVRASSRSGGLCRDRTTAGNTAGRIDTANAIAGNIAGPGADRAARSRTTRRHGASPHAARRRSASRSSPVAAEDRARSRDAGAEHRTAQGHTAANGCRQFKSHWRAQGQPGRNETDACEGARAAPAAQGVTASKAAGFSRAQAGADVSAAAAGASAAAILPEGAVVLRRLVAASAAIVETPFLTTPARYAVRRNTIRDVIEQMRLA